MAASKQGRENENKANELLKSIQGSTAAQAAKKPAAQAPVSLDGGVTGKATGWIKRVGLPKAKAFVTTGATVYGGWLLVPLTFSHHWTSVITASLLLGGYSVVQGARQKPFWSPLKNLTTYIAKSIGTTISTILPFLKSADKSLTQAAGQKDVSPDSTFKDASISDSFNNGKTTAPKNDTAPRPGRDQKLNP